MRAAILLLCSALLCSALVGASSPARAQTVPPALMVQLPGGAKAGRSQPIALRSVEATVAVHGFLAETTLTMTFFNPHQRVLEGQLYLPLPEGATVSGYALDVGGAMVEGVVVEKEKARVVFEKEVRRGVDPGIVEWVKGNTFKTRVYPLPARGTRTVSVTYVSELAARGNDARYLLPLAFKQPLERFRLTIDVARARATPRATWGGPKKVTFRLGRDGYHAETEVRRARLTGQLVVDIPQAATPGVMVEEGPDGTIYFCVQDVPKDPRGSVAQRPITPRRVTVLWDASHSRGQEDHTLEFALLERYFAHHRAAPVEVDLVLFRDRADPPRRYTVKGGDTRQLLADLRTVNYDGGTQMAAVAPAGKARVPDLYLLFSDGLSTFGNEIAGGFRAPLYTFSAGSSTNPALLRHLAESAGGQYHNLAQVDLPAVVAGLGRPAFSFLSADVKTAEVGHTFPRQGEPVRGRFALAGKLRAPQATVTLRYGIAGKELTSRTFKISRAAAVKGRLVTRYWAQRQLQTMMVSPQRHQEAMVALGKRFGLVTPWTSLIVLERLEQYVEHEIEPPASLPEMRKSYRERVASRGAQQQRDSQEKLERIIELWQQRVEWWSTKFTYPKDYRHGEAAPKKGRRLAAAPPAPMEEEAMEMADSKMAEADMAPPGRPSAAPAGREVAAKKPKNGDGDEGHASEPAIALAPWDPQTPYIAALKRAPKSKRYAVYMEQKKSHGTAPAFYLDCADFFLRKGERRLALRILSTVAELKLQDAALLRVLAHRLAQLDLLEPAALLFDEVRRLRPEEPQSFRDLGLVLARQRKYARAMELLSHVVMNRWDRFDEIEVIALMELNNIIPKARAAGVKELPVDPRLVKQLDVDIRILLSWDADLTDIDMWVIEPSGEKAYYGNNRTTIGGLVSRDFTQGYGPEAYLLRRAMRGTYKVQTNFFGSSAQQLTGAVTLQLDLFTNYGRPNQKHKSVTLRLSENKETITVGELEF